MQYAYWRQGIGSAEQARIKIEAGATAVQLYGPVLSGLSLVTRINAGHGMRRRRLAFPTLQLRGTSTGAGPKPKRGSPAGQCDPNRLAPLNRAL